MVRLILALALLAAPLAAEAADAPLRGQLRAKRQATLSAGLSGEIEKMPVREGDRVAEGALVAAIDCSPQQASRRVAEAKLAAAQAKHKSAQRLAELNQASVLEVEVARSEAAMAAAELTSIGATLRKCESRAPFAGVVVAQMSRQNQYIREGEPLVELVDADGLEIEMVLPSRWLEWLKPGSAFEMAVDELHRSVPARIDRIGGRVDPVSQTVRVLGRIEGKNPDLLPGMSGLLVFPGKPQ
jgi:membrane fusion protein (multidrug efflux system)